MKGHNKYKDTPDNHDFMTQDHDENGCTFFWNTYSWPRFSEFIATLGVRMEKHYIQTPGAAHADTIVRLIK